MLPFLTDHDLFDACSFSCDEQSLVLHPEQTHPPSSPNFLPFSPFTDDLLLFPTANTSMSAEADTAEPPRDPQVAAKEPPSAPPGKSSSKRSLRKRAVRKDRHSKIETAQGPRDRRMRLSLDVARKFFDLQELLGFDKPSKTVQWLLNNSRSAIREIIATSATAKGSFKSESYASECEETSTVSCPKAKPPSVAKEKTTSAAAARACKKIANRPEKIIRATRAKARERARERTMTKKMILKQPLIPSSSPIQLEIIEEDRSMISHDPKSSSIELVAETHHHLDYQQNFLGSKEAISIIQEQCDSCYPVSIYPRLWEAYANQIL